MKNKKSLIKYLIEALLIVFSVLLALLLNEYRENLKQKKVIRKNLQSIEEEMRSNLSVINDWIPYHQQVLINIERAIESDSIQNLLITDRGFDIFQIAPKGIFQNNMSQTAWNVGQGNGIISSLDYETVYLLSKTYDLQENSVKRSIEEILRELFSKEAIQSSNVKETLILLYTKFKILGELEVSLKGSIETSLKQLPGKSP